MMVSYGHTLELVTSAKYLGLTITNKLQWDQHITAKANKTLGFLRRNLKIPVIFICDSEVYDGIISKESDFGG
jgi:hypothetical protein